MKELLIDNLSTLLAYNVIGDIQYRNRFNGFIGELDFKEYMTVKRPSNRMLDGGIFLPVIKDKASLDNPVYFTTSSDEPIEYVELYSKISELTCKNLYYLKWFQDTDQWEKADVMGVGKQLLSPPLEVFKFFEGKFVDSTLVEFLAEFTNCSWKPEDQVPAKIKELFADSLMRFDSPLLLDLYVQRYVFDGLIGLKKHRGIPSDIDLVVRSYITGELIAFEVKEKDLSKNPPIGFGMDIPRIKFYEDFSQITGIKAFYIVKQVRDQISRKFLNWRCINMDDFVKYSVKKQIEGGTGMRSVTSSNPTNICLDKYFKTL